MAGQAARQLSRMFQNIAVAINAHKDHLSALDGAIGDADHGITMALGFAAVNNQLAKLNIDILSPSDVLTTAASSFLDAVGASTGPLYATAFRRAAQEFRLIDDFDDVIDKTSQCRLVHAMMTGIRERGKGQRGDKTMLDSWIPAAEAANAALSQTKDIASFWGSILEAAEHGADATRSMVAAKGRAARLGERSLGHMDPGAASAVIILSAMRDTFLREENAG